jgi:hypothetical protein
MHNDTSYEIVMSFKSFHLLHRIVVEDTHLKIIATCHHPVFATYKFDSSDREGRSFDSTNAGLFDMSDTLLA